MLVREVVRRQFLLNWRMRTFYMGQWRAEWLATGLRCICCIDWLHRPLNAVAVCCC